MSIGILGARKRTRTKDIAINAQAVVGVKWLAKMHSGLAASGYTIKPSVSDLLKTAIEVICISTVAVEFETDAEAINYLKISGINLALTPEQIGQANANFSATPLNLTDAKMASFAAQIPAEMKDKVSPQGLAAIEIYLRIQQEAHDRGRPVPTIMEVRAAVLKRRERGLPDESVTLEEALEERGDPEDAPEAVMDKCVEAGIVQLPPAAPPKKEAIEGVLVEEDPAAAKQRQLEFLQRMRAGATGDTQ